MAIAVPSSNRCVCFHFPRLDDLDGLDIRFLAPAASTAFGQRKASRPLGARLKAVTPLGQNLLGGCAAKWITTQWL